MDGLNWYEYCRSNPLKYTDPTGNVPAGAENWLNLTKPREYAEDDILDNTGKAPYVGVFFLNREDGAGGFGHVAMMLYRSDGIGDLYSYVGTTPSPTVAGGYNDANVNYAYGVDVEAFLKGEPNNDGKIEHKIKNPRGIRLGFDEQGKPSWATSNEVYDRGIYFHISDAQGQRMKEAADKTIREVNGIGYHMPDYHVLTNNCDTQTRKWLKAGGIEIERGVSFKIFPKVAPNSIYKNKIEGIKKEDRKDELSAPIYGNLSDIWGKIPHKNTVMLYPFYR